jgi:Putative glucose uptake permease
MNITGIIISFISSIFFSLYIIPKKMAKIKPIYFVFYMSISAFIISFIFYLFQIILNGNFNEPFFDKILLLTALRGIIWFLGSTLFFTSIDLIGVAKANQWKVLQGPVGSLLMFFFFNEYLNINFSFILISLILIIISALLINSCKRTQEKINKKGIIYAVMSALLLGINAFIQKLVTNKNIIYTQIVYQTFFIMISATIYILIKEKKLSFKNSINFKNKFFSFISGILYFGANYSSTLAYKRLEGSVVFIIIQFNSVWTLLISILLLKEIKFQNNAFKIIGAIMLAIISMFILLI